MSENDWGKFLKEVNFTTIDIDNYLNNVLDTPQFDSVAGEVIDVKNSAYIKKKSKIHGYGVFAKKNISKGDIIGVVIGFNNGNKYRSHIGRFTNHSVLKNTIFKLISEDVVAECVVNIKKGEEILVDYRDHWGKF